MRGKLYEIDGVLYQRVGRAKKTTKSSKSKKQEALKFWTEKLGKTVKRQGFKMALPVKTGTKQYEGVEFTDGTLAVFIRGDSVLKKAWA